MDKEIKNYIGAIKKAANKMYLESPIVDKDDLIQAGFIGMINGLKSFSEEKAKDSKTKKTTYVIRCINNEILNEANKFFGVTALPYNKRLKFNIFKKYYTQNKTKEEILKLANINDDIYNEFESLLKLRTSSQLDKLNDDDIGALLKVDSKDINLDDYNMTIDEKTIISFKLSGMTYAQIGDFLGLGTESVRNRIHKIMEKIINNE